jgi:hypothetical protein
MTMEGPPQDPHTLSAEEQAQLDAFAKELRDAHPEPKLSSGWQEKLHQRMWSQGQHDVAHWTLRLSMEKSPWMRVAASLLLIAVVAAPVSAIFSLMVGQKQEAFTLGFDPAIPDLPERHQDSLEANPNLGSGTDAIHGVRPPFGEEQEFAWSPAALEALSRSNRLALASQRWLAASQNGDLFESLEARAQRLRDSAGAKPDGVWSQASEQDLWDAFLLRCSQGSLDVPETALFARAQELRQTLSDGAPVPAGVAAWIWVADGTRLAGQEQGWAKAPFRP